MLRITEDPSSGSLVQCLAKNYKNDSVMSVDMDKVDVMAACCDPLCVCVFVYTVNYTHTHTHKTHSKTCWSTFKYFIILILSTYYILCISWVIKCLIIIDARCKHEIRCVCVCICMYVPVQNILTFMR